MSHIINRIKELRDEKNWNRGEFSRRSGVKVHTIWGIEKYHRDIPVSRALEIAKAFNLTVEDVFTPTPKGKKKA